MLAQKQKGFTIVELLIVIVGEILRPVTYVRKDLKELTERRDAITAEITEKVDQLEQLRRDLASVNARIKPMDDSMKARFGHDHTPVADSA